MTPHSAAFGRWLPPAGLFMTGAFMSSSKVVPYTTRST